MLIPRSISKSLSRKILVGVLLISSVFTIVIALSQVIVDYHSLVDETELQLSLIEKGYLDGISQSVWDMNQAQQEAQYQGILNIPGMSYIEVMNTDNVVVKTQGIKPDRAMVRFFPIQYSMATGEQVNLGQLIIHADMQDIYDKIISKLMLILGTQFVKTVGVSLIILWFIQFLFTRHLISLERHLVKINLTKAPEQFGLDRGLFSQCGDELDQLVDSVNEMKSQLYQHTQLLEQKVSERTAALERSSKAKTQFLANMSHDLRTPMNGVLGMLSIVQDTQLDSLQRHYLDIAHQSGVTLLNLLNDILDLSKIEEGKLQIENIEFNINLVIEEIFTLLGESCYVKGVELVAHPVNDFPEVVVGDPIRFKQILFNILGNAIKFTHSGYVRLKSQFINRENDHLVFRFEIQDTGIWIKEEAKKIIFEHFSQADSSTTRKFGGSGLGLSLCKQLVHLLDGEIGVESECDKGSTFWFTVKFKDAKKEGQAIQPPSLSSINRVLIVDDQKVSIDALGKILDRYKIGFDFITEPETLWQYYANNPNCDDQAIFIDLAMDNFDYDRLIRLTAEGELLANIPLVFMGSLSQHNDFHANIKNAIDYFVSKPFRCSNIEEVLLLIDVRIKKASLGYPLKNSQPLTVTDDELINLETHQHKVISIDEKTLKQHHTASKFLVVEDNIVNQKVSCACLKQLGYEVDLANNGADALTMIENNRYDIVFMDCQMPILDGYETTLAIRNAEVELNQQLKNTAYSNRNKVKVTHESKSPLIIIAMTANVMEGDKQRCLDAGMNDFIPKPINRAELQTIIAKWLP